MLDEWRQRLRVIKRTKMNQTGRFPNTLFFLEIYNTIKKNKIPGYEMFLKLPIHILQNIAQTMIKFVSRMIKINIS